MSLQDLSAERLAMLLHDAQQAMRLETGPGAAALHWTEMPQAAKKNWVAVARLVLRNVAAGPEPVASPDPFYFAKPGEAQWGC